MKKNIGFNGLQIKQLTDIVSEVVDSKLKIRLKPLEKDVKKIKDDLSVTITFFDREIITHDKRITNIENQLHLHTN